MSTGVTAASVPFVIIAQEALPSEGNADTNSPADVDPVAVAEASRAEGLVPDSMLAPYTTDGLVTVEGGIAAQDLEFDVSTLAPTMTYAVTPGTVSFVWAEVAGATRYLVARDGVQVSESKDASYSESALDVSSKYEYTIEAVAADGAALSSRIIPIETLSWSPAKAEIVPMTYQPYNTAFTYETFIADDRVSLGFFETLGCGLAGPDDYRFGGDNRGFRMPLDAPSDAADYRTMVFTNINWTNDVPYNVIWSYAVGTTHLYKNGSLWDARTASADGIVVSDAYQSGSYAQSRWQHSVGNPYCVAGAITYDIVVRFYRSGTIEIVGSRYPVPNHEAYGRWNFTGTNSWATLYQDTNDGFGCLTGACGYDSISVSKTR